MNVQVLEDRVLATFANNRMFHIAAKLILDGNPLRNINPRGNATNDLWADPMILAYWICKNITDRKVRLQSYEERECKRVEAFLDLLQSKLDDEGNLEQIIKDLI